MFGLRMLIVKDESRGPSYQYYGRGKVKAMSLVGKNTALVIIFCFLRNLLCIQRNVSFLGRISLLHTNTKPYMHF